MVPFPEDELREALKKAVKWYGVEYKEEPGKSFEQYRNDLMFITTIIKKHKITN